MVTSWRRAFCTSIPKDPESITIKTEKHRNEEDEHCYYSPRIKSKFGFLSNPSTPRSHKPISSTSSLPNTPKLHIKTSSSDSVVRNSLTDGLPRQLSSPKSPSTFSLLKSTLRLSKSNRCGICSESVKSGQGRAIFTAECGHVFHFPCIKKQNSHFCPVCNAYISLSSPKTQSAPKNLRVYNDDDPLLLSSPPSLFYPIPELDENDEFQVSDKTPSYAGIADVECVLLQESAVVSIGRTHQTHVVVMRVKAPPASLMRGARRIPVDLVAVLDVSQGMCGIKALMMKRLMKLVLSSLGSKDRLSIVAFSASSKRLLPLKLMTPNGRRSARRVVDALGNTGEKMCVGDAIKKAAKVVEDRREKNPVATILIISDRQQDRSHVNFDHKRAASVVCSTRFTHSDIPVHSIGFGDTTACSNAQVEDAFRKCVNGVLNVVAQDVNIQLGFVPGSGQVEIPAVYTVSGRPGVFGPGSVRLGDFYAEEERDLLVELRVPTSSIGSGQVLSVQSVLKDPATQELIQTKKQNLCIPRAQAVRSSVPGIQRLRSIHVSTRAVAESRRLVEHGDLSGSYYLLSSARALLMQSKDGSASEFVRGLEAELADLQRKRQILSQRQRNQPGDEKPEALTPTSAWRAAERLAKVAIMRKHMNRVSDLHGFENARF